MFITRGLWRWRRLTVTIDHRGRRGYLLLQLLLLLPISCNRWRPTACIVDQRMVPCVQIVACGQG